MAFCSINNILRFIIFFPLFFSHVCLRLPCQATADDPHLVGTRDGWKGPDGAKMSFWLPFHCILLGFSK